MILLIDNYDSFTFNLVHHFGALGVECDVRRNDALSVEEALALKPEAIVISPGPCAPDQAGICCELIEKAAGIVPVLGVCLGHQAIGQVFGARVVRAPVPMHGKISTVTHNNTGVFSNLPQSLKMVRYHSLTLDPDTIPDCLEVNARSDDGVIMGVRHRQYPIHGVQFHPESIASSAGRDLLANFLSLAGIRGGRQKGTFTHGLKQVISGKSLTSEEAEAAFEEIMKGQVPESQLASFLTALYMRGETKEELLGAVKAVRRQMRKLDNVPENTIDVCGTGGDGLGTLNVSTAVSFVLAGLGVPVAKHGNRALSSLSGATDVLEALGIPSDGDVGRQEKRLGEDNIAFLAAPHHHPSMKFALPVRKALGFRTLFNLLGPLCNPAQVKRQLVGVFDGRWCEPIVQVLGALGGTHIWAVHGRTDEGGIDEITLAGPTDVAVWEDGKTRFLTLEPEMGGFSFMPVHLLRGGGAESNAQRMRALFEGETGCYRDTVLFNAAIALHIAGKGSILDGKGVSSEGLRANIRQAAQSLDQGWALNALKRVQESFLPVT